MHLVLKISGDELKAISKENIPVVKVKKQDTQHSYRFGESGNQKIFLQKNEKNQAIYRNRRSWQHL